MNTSSNYLIPCNFVIGRFYSIRIPLRDTGTLTKNRALNTVIILPQGSAIVTSDFRGLPECLQANAADNIGYSALLPHPQSVIVPPYITGRHTIFASDALNA
jgi:hypothetical protein